jgi:hypothetical protein
MLSIQVLSLTSRPQVPENIAPLKVIVYKSKVDAATLKQKAEEMKSELFVKRFSKPNPEDIHVVSVDKHYEPYIVVDAKYRIDYHNKKVYSIEVADKAEEVKILGESFKPQKVPVRSSEPEGFRKVISLEGQELFVYEDKAYFILDKSGKEISPDKMPIAPSEERPEQILKQFKKNTEEVTMPDREVLLRVKSKLVKRPSDVGTVGKELFHVTEHAIIYSPFYKITFRNMKNKKEETVSIDGITAEIKK